MTGIDLFRTSLRGKSGILTGGSSGFGFEIVKYLISQGAKVAVFSVDTPSDESQAELDAISGGTAEYMIQDIMAAGASEIIVNKAVELFGTVDFCIINAGFAIRFEKPLLEMDISEIEDSLKTQFNVFPVACISLAITASRVMRQKYEKIGVSDTGHLLDSGSIVITLSEAVLCPLRDDLLAYAAAKNATLSALRSLAATFGPYNIRVNGVAPGFANTAGPQKFYGRFPEIRDDIESKNHLKPSFMHPGSVLPAISYLLTDNYVTGEVIALDGGYNIDMKRYFQG
jgi:3-oxoacyl-[acyl-carrier protein] reductase